MSTLQKNSFVAAVIIGLIFGFAAQGSAKCGNGGFLNPVADISYNNIFPLKIASIPIGTNNSDMVEPEDPADQSVCYCPLPPPVFERVGISIGLWEPAHYIETVSQAWCMPSFGRSMNSDKKNTLGGSLGISGNGQDTASFAQAHYFVFSPWVIMDVIGDFVCLESTGFDLAYMTEVDVMWQDDELSFIIQPEALVFANQIAQLACVADSVTTNLLGLPLSFLPHCVASGGSVYPLSGHVNDPRFVQANQTIASRMIYKLCREGLIMDPGVYLCSATMTPIWIKHNYRFQIAKPVRGFIAHPPGRTSLLWGFSKNPAMGAKNSDNFIFIVFRKRTCCAA